MPPTPEGLAEAVDCLRADEVVAYPTETVYGLAVNPASPAALERLFAVKGRDAAKAVLLIIGDLEHLGGIAQAPSAAARACIEAFWPGPLSLLLPAAEGLAPELVGAGGKVCVRCPGCETARALCDAFGGALTSTSANQSGAAPARSVAALDLAGVALALDGGELKDTAVSTIYDPDTRKVLREGAIPAGALEGY